MPRQPDELYSFLQGKEDSSSVVDFVTGLPSFSRARRRAHGMKPTVRNFLQLRTTSPPSPLRTSCASFVIISGGQGRMPGELDGAQKRAGSKRIAVRFRKFLLWNAKWRRLEFEAGDTRCKIQARILSDHRRSILPREKLAAHRPNKERGDNGGGKTKKVAGSRCPRA